MKRPVTVLLGFHNHQPVGNFDHVVAQTTELAYLPFLNVAREFPRVRFALHNSGCLWEWFERHRPEYFDVLLPLVERGQVELLSGGFYEPILTAIPHRDRVAQIARMRHYLRDRFGSEQRGEGLWLTERVWEQGLVRSLVEAGIRYSAVDDYHFGLVGKTSSELHGYYRTEDEGLALDLFPIDQQLRYLTPFATVDKVAQYIDRCRDIRNVGDVPIALPIWDDGEKLGAWPKTHQWVYTEGWLERFFTLLSDESQAIEMALPGEFVDRVPPLGTVYLPDASYQEMGVWSLPPDLASRVDEALHEAERHGTLDEARRLYNPATWRNFMVRYDEANLIHKRMLFVSAELARLREKQPATDENAARFDAVETNLFKGQCNCAYWHGVFGGLYLPHLRRALFVHLIKAETELLRIEAGDAVGDESGAARAEPRARFVDYDFDGRDEIIIRHPDATLWLHPARGGMLAGWDLHAQGLNLLNTLARRREAYHDAPVRVDKPTEEADCDEDQATIHDIEKALTPEQAAALVYDWHPRLSGLDHLHAIPDDGGPPAPAAEYRANRVRDAGDFVLEPFDEIASVDPLAFTLTRRGHLFLDHLREGKAGHPLTIAKTYCLRPSGGLDYSVTIANAGAELIELDYAPEFNFGLFAGDDPDRHWQFPDGSSPLLGEDVTPAQPLTELTLRSAPEHLTIRIELDPPAAVRAFPIATVSQSERDFETIFQSAVLLPHFRLALPPGKGAEVRVRFNVASD